MHVEELWRFPVKSVGGERVDEVGVTEHGLVGDRAFGFVDVATGMVLTARRVPSLLQGAATWLDEGRSDGDVRITVDDEVLTTDDQFSDWLGRAVVLKRAGDVGGTFENLLDVDNEADWVTWTGPPTAWHDSGRTRVSLVSRATLGDWDVRRFRANVVLGGAVRPGQEDDLVGDQLSLGTCRLSVGKQVDRCIMVTRAQPGLERDLEVLRSIHRQRGGNLAVGALVDVPGTVRVGDPLVAG